MALLDDLLLGFDEALEWPLDDDLDEDPAARAAGSDAWAPCARGW